MAMPVSTSLSPFNRRACWRGLPIRKNSLDLANPYEESGDLEHRAGPISR